MNITLSADKEVILRARAVAGRYGKSLNQLVREYLASLSIRNDGEDAAQALFALMDQGQGRLDSRRFLRDELHER